MLCITDIIERSLCSNCVHRVQRTISSEGLEIYDEEGEVYEEGEEIELIHESCSLLHTELDHIVLKCSGHTSITSGDTLFFTEYFKP